jgi:hypothetical protein
MDTVFCFLLAFAVLRPHTANGPRNAGSALFQPSRPDYP